MKEIYPSVKESAPPLECMQNEGDIVYVPEGWCVVGRGHALLLTVVEIYHSAPLRSIGHPLMYRHLAVGFGRIVAWCDHSSTLYHTH